MDPKVNKSEETNKVSKLVPANALSCEDLMDHTKETVRKLKLTIAQSINLNLFQQCRNGTFSQVHTFPVGAKETEMDHVVYSMSHPMKEGCSFQYRMANGVRGVYFPNGTSLVFHPTNGEAIACIDNRQYSFTIKTVPDVLTDLVKSISMKQFTMSTPKLTSCPNLFQPQLRHVVAWFAKPSQPSKCFVFDDGTIQVNDPPSILLWKGTKLTHILDGSTEHGKSSVVFDLEKINNYSDEDRAYVKKSITTVNWYICVLVNRKGNNLNIQTINLE